jgi:hypothetical protein
MGGYLAGTTRASPRTRGSTPPPHRLEVGNVIAHVPRCDRAVMDRSSRDPLPRQAFCRRTLGAVSSGFSGAGTCAGRPSACRWPPSEAHSPLDADRRLDHSRGARSFLIHGGARKHPSPRARSTPRRVLAADPSASRSTASLPTAGPRQPYALIRRSLGTGTASYRSNTVGHLLSLDGNTTSAVRRHRAAATTIGPPPRLTASGRCRLAARC